MKQYEWTKPLHGVSHIKDIGEPHNRWFQVSLDGIVVTIFFKPTYEKIQVFIDSDVDKAKVCAENYLQDNANVLHTKLADFKAKNPYYY